MPVRCPLSQNPLLMLAGEALFTGCTHGREIRESVQHLPSLTTTRLLKCELPIVPLFTA
ncbi:hypothetical protein DPMN_007361 [Dreissena polymorpha]|uniref:Uncharacterized protein n=1 Tax=Dreissena polymorpha TaxID=45954 RepID=A0A9D4MWW1_DREPO|nr:hypothetical protein DPMN_007361 [Dreissena polymorpha]